MPLLMQIVESAITVMTVLIVVRAFWSWVSPYPTNAPMRFVWNVTEPILGPLRSILPNLGGLDLSPLVAILLLNGLEYLLVRM